MPSIIALGMIRKQISLSLDRQDRINWSTGITFNHLMTPETRLYLEGNLLARVYLLQFLILYNLELTERLQGLLYAVYPSSPIDKHFALRVFLSLSMNVYIPTHTHFSQLYENKLQSLHLFTRKHFSVHIF